MKKKIIVGLDFDGVVAYNPARLARLPISFVKQQILGIHTVSFFVPRSPLTRSLWALAHETSVFPANGVSMLRNLTRDGKVEAHLVTARFAFLEEHLHHFLRRWHLDDVFTSITLNAKEEQPHLFKARMIKEKRFDYYIEDNWDIVEHLTTLQVPTRIHWIYNILDRGRTYPFKYPYLSKSLEKIAGDSR